MILLSLFVNVVVVMIIYKKYNFTRDEIIGALVYENVGIIFGAKILTYIINYSKYDQFEFLKIGLTSSGACLGAFICLFLFGLQFKKSSRSLLFTFTPSIPLMYGISKIGCFLVGCCYGIKYDGIGSIVYEHSLAAPNHVHLFPVQLIESIIFIFIFIYMISNVFKNKYNWKVLGIGTISSGVVKFILDYFRHSHIKTIISVNQLFCLLFIIIGFIFVFKKDNFLVCDNCNRELSNSMKWCPFCGNKIKY